MRVELCSVSYVQVMALWVLYGYNSRTLISPNQLSNFILINDTNRIEYRLFDLSNNKLSSVAVICELGWEEGGMA
jgi:hypothetical protein